MHLSVSNKNDERVSEVSHIRFRLLGVLISQVSEVFFLPTGDGFS